MTSQARRAERRRCFDLRSTAMFFLLLTILLRALTFLARTAAAMVERRPPSSLGAAEARVAGVALQDLQQSRAPILRVGRHRRAGPNGCVTP
ncbi:hypothetical protein L1856_09110 [Streptomyces sp. Tue 6430]|nr:hypothetical protein [Streptomyces sp. Tue 6430]